MYIKPCVTTLTHQEIQKLLTAKASGCTGYCSPGATYCAKGSNYSSSCDATVIYCSGGNYTGTSSADITA